LHVADADQLGLKVQSALPELPAALTDVLLPSTAWIRSEEPLNYRHKAIFLPKIWRKGLELGAYARRSHEVVALPRCEVITPALREARDVLRKALQNPVLAQRLALRSVILRANAAGQVLATLILRQPIASSRRAQSELVDLVESLITGPSPLVGVHIQVHDAEGDAVSGSGPVTRIGGGDYLSETIGALKFRIRPLAFFQINPAVLTGIVGLLQDRLIDCSGTGAVAPLLLDLYCGGGALGLSTLAERPHWRLLGIDTSAPNIEDALSNAAALGMEHRSFRIGRVVDLLGSSEWAEANAAILDPPRNGLRPEVLAALADSGPAQLFYVACSTRSLARDAAALLDAGYEAEFLCPADMMPQTPYIEWVAGFTRSTSA
jgi:23S rRNA (uracil1939-C5)-methyltransferase